MADGAAFIAVEVEPGAASPDGVTLRFKAAGPPRPVARLRYEDDDGVAGVWRVHAVHDAAGAARGAATAVLVEDSSEGTVCLVVGGSHGLVLEHEASGRERREAYLVLAAHTERE